MRLYEIDRQNDKGTSLSYKAKRRSTYLLDEDLVILNELNTN
jgi:hypothetical protein